MAAALFAELLRSLSDERVVAFEALSRWPMFATMTPQNVFSFANVSQQADALDHQCIESAARAALASELPRNSLLLINTEPAVAHIPRATDTVLSEACERFQVVFELTERRLLAHPKALLEKVAAIRADGIAACAELLQRLTRALPESGGDVAARRRPRP